MKDTAAIHNVIIIGSGPAGLTAGIYTSRADLKPLIIEGKNPGGQLMGTSFVENWPGDVSILGPTLMNQMRNHATALGCTFSQQEVTWVDFTQQPFIVGTQRATFKTKSVIIATGASPKKLGIANEEQYWGKGVTVCAVCDGAFYRDKQVIVVGGGDTAMEDASFLTKFTDKIIIVHILDALTASAAMQKRVLNNAKITIIYSSTITAIQGDGNRLTQVTITNQKTGQEQTVPADGLFIAIGLNPNTEIFKNQVELDAARYVVVKNQTHTSVPGVFVAGDAADHRYRQAITSAGSGCMAAIDVERYLSAL